jgi:prepilin-type N-terminal cleavage/methylation domain-containing protein
MNRHGITLIEILISMAIFGILIIAVTNLFFSGIAVWDYGEKISRGLTEIEFFFNKLTNDFASNRPFLYSGVFFSDEYYFVNFFNNNDHSEKFSDDVKSFLLPYVPERMDDFFSGTKVNMQDFQDYFMSDSALKDWFVSGINRQICWDFFNKEKWGKWLHNIPAIDWKDIGLFTDKGMIYYSLGNNSSYTKYHGLAFFYSPDDKSVNYYKINVQNPDNILLRQPEKIIENVVVFNLKYYTKQHEEIPLSSVPKFVLAGLIEYVELEIEIEEDKVFLQKKKTFMLNLNEK